jgi:hypothetical protein
MVEQDTSGIKEKNTYLLGLKRVTICFKPFLIYKKFLLYLFLHK